MLKAFLFIFIFFAAPMLALAANGDIAVSEVLFDPAGTDTGLEYIVIKNFGSGEVNLSGWDLYPAGVGYYTFPSFTLVAGSAVKVHIRASGSDGPADLYYASASGNIGNSSGSIALFSGTTHSKDTIVAFMRYQKPGSSESKTWESSASDSGLWSSGDFIDISDFAEGQILKLQNFNQKNSSQGWGIEDSGNPQVSSAPTQTISSSSESTQATAESSGDSGVVVMAESTSKIKAYEGEDRRVLAGAEVIFDGASEGFTEDSVNKARFFWNFGDGKTAEGKSVTHAFFYPGSYNIFLTVSFAGMSGSDSAKITVVENPVIVSEVKPGDFVEIYNASSRKIDFSGSGISIGSSGPFYFPAGTFLQPYAYIALETGVLNFQIPKSGSVRIIYPNGKVSFSSVYPDTVLADGESLSFAGDERQKSKATPGEKNEVLKTVASKPKKPAVPPAETNFKPVASSENAISKKNPQNSLLASAEPANSYRQSLLSGEYGWLVVGLGAGVLAGAAFIFAKRYFP